jgi:hypothetical protein
MKGADYQMPSFQASAAPEAGHTRVSDFSQLIKTRLTFFGPHYHRSLVFISAVPIQSMLFAY